MSLGCFTTMPIKLDKPQHKEDTQLGDGLMSYDRDEATQLTQPIDRVTKPPSRTRKPPNWLKDYVEYRGSF